MLEELQRRKNNTDTILGYSHAIEEFSRYVGTILEQMGPDEIREFQLYMIREKKLVLGAVALRTVLLCCAKRPCAHAARY